MTHHRYSRAELAEMRANWGRTSNRPQKQLFFDWAFTEITNNREVGTCIDYAGGTMSFRALVPGAKYIGVDPHKPSTEIAKSNLPNDTIYECTIQDAPDHLKGDVVLCFEAIGINEFFDVSQTGQVLTKMISAVKPKGRILFNVGPTASHMHGEICEILKSSFVKVEFKTYGSFDEPRPGRFSKFLVLAMHALPFLARLNRQTRRYFYIATGKIPDSAE